MQFHHQVGLGINRDDVLWALARADFLNAHRGEGEMPFGWKEVSPYFDPLDFGDEPDLTHEQLLERIGFGTAFRGAVEEE